MEINSAFRQRCDRDILTADGSENLVHVYKWDCQCKAMKMMCLCRFYKSIHLSKPFNGS